MKKKTNEERKRMGDRAKNSDGFTYSYGRYKFSDKGKRRMEYVRRSMRIDKKGWKFRHKVRLMKEYGVNIK